MFSEHPLIGNISGLSLEEIGKTVSDLHKKLSIAQRSGNGHLSTQIRMALETYQNQYQRLLRETWQSQGGQDFSDRINIE